MHRSIPHMFSILVRFKHPFDSSGTFASNSPSSQSNRSKYEYHLTRINLDIQTKNAGLRVRSRSQSERDLERNWTSPRRRIRQSPLKKLFFIPTSPHSPSPILQSKFSRSVERGPPPLLQVLGRRLSEYSDRHLRHTTTRTWEGLSRYLARHDHMT